MRLGVFPAAALGTLGFLPIQALASDILKTDGFESCLENSDIKVDRVSFLYDRSISQASFDLAGTSPKEEDVIISLVIYAYGKEVYKKDFDPCIAGSNVEQLCPVPAGNFVAQGVQSVPAQFASQIPSIAFSIPDLEGEAKLELKAKDSGNSVACIQSAVSNGRSLEVRAVSYVAAGMAGAALAMSGASAFSAVGVGHSAVSASSTGPSFGAVLGWFHTLATSGMLSVDYPAVYRSFSKNFAFSTGLIPWNSMQTSIDNFRNRTGGNLTDNSFAFLRQASLAYEDGTIINASSVAKRAVDLLGPVHLVPRDDSSANGTGDGSSDGGIQHMVKGIQGYVEQLSIPQANTFMTILLIFAIVVAAITVGILLTKVVLEVWALYGRFPDKLTDFRKDYWGLLTRTLTNLILLLYGIWTLYCVFQFTRGDSWAAKLLAAVTLVIFTSVLAFFTFRIWQLARKYKKTEGDTSVLFENREVWRKYSLFYDSYKKDYWWIFVPVIFYTFIRGVIIAAGDGHGLAQSAGQFVIEALMLALLLWHRPYETKSSQWINISIQAVRVLSVACVLVFVEELGISKTTKTATGIALIAIQSTLTAVLAILIAVNAIITCIRENPHARRQREAEKLNRDLDNLTPLDARNSLLMEHRSSKDDDFQEMSKFNTTGPYEPYRDQAPRKSRHAPTESTDRLISADSFDRQHTRSPSRDSRESRSHSPSLDGRKSDLPSYGLAH
ncbi:hypothetical protein VTN00DRAFT_4604 [Thermoascus crustaceus]|uniref:uncharacterized protein n=1 Tax=Thermoascus crustaceus TaxID=5088 RepID=UPI0037426A65